MAESSPTRTRTILSYVVALAIPVAVWGFIFFYGHHSGFFEEGLFHSSVTAVSPSELLSFGSASTPFFRLLGLAMAATGIVMFIYLLTSLALIRTNRHDKTKPLVTSVGVIAVLSIFIVIPLALISFSSEPDSSPTRGEVTAEWANARYGLDLTEDEGATLAEFGTVTGDDGKLYELKEVGGRYSGQYTLDIRENPDE